MTPVARCRVCVHAEDQAVSGKILVWDQNALTIITPGVLVDLTESQIEVLKASVIEIHHENGRVERRPRFRIEYE